MTQRLHVHLVVGGVNTRRLECSLDAAPYTACRSPQTYTGLAVGAHTFRATAVDGAGNVDPTPVSNSWTIVP